MGPRVLSSLDRQRLGIGEQLGRLGSPSYSWHLSSLFSVSSASIVSIVVVVVVVVVPGG